MDIAVYLPVPAEMQSNLHNEVVFSRLYSSGGPFASSYAVKGEGHRRGNDRWSTPSPHKTQLKSLIAAFTLITAIIFLILVCRSVRSRAQWVITRKLSSEGNLSDSGSDDVVICEDRGEERPEDSTQQSPQVLLTPPKAKKAKVESGEGHDAAHSSVESESGSDDDEPSTSAGRKRKRKAQAPSSETPSGEGPESTARSDEELEAASALLDLQQSFEAAGVAPPEAEESPAASPPSAAPVHGPTTSAGEAQVSVPILMQHPLQPITILLPVGSALIPTQVVTPTPGAALEGEATGIPIASTSSAPLPGEEEPSTSSAAGESAVPPRPPVHPYYRIPTVSPLHRGVRRFKPELTTQYGLAFRSLSRQLKRMRGLLGKETLTPLELEELAQATAEILAFVVHYEGYSTRKAAPSRAALDLGRRFLLLDSAIAALQVLEEPACGDWWNRVVNIIPDDTLEDPTAYVPAVSGPAASFNMDLVRRLHGALRMLKTGQRLRQEETIAIKRDLFCSPHSPGNFKKPSWDPWRKDDENFSGTS